MGCLRVFALKVFTALWARDHAGCAGALPWRRRAEVPKGAQRTGPSNLKDDAKSLLPKA